MNFSQSNVTTLYFYCHKKASALLISSLSRHEVQSSQVPVFLTSYVKMDPSMATVFEWVRHQCFESQVVPMSCLIIGTITLCRAWACVRRSVLWRNRHSWGLRMVFVFGDSSIHRGGGTGLVLYAPNGTDVYLSSKLESLVLNTKLNMSLWS